MAMFVDDVDGHVHRDLVLVHKVKDDSREPHIVWPSDGRLRGPAPTLVLAGNLASSKEVLDQARLGESVAVSGHLALISR